MNNGNGNGGGFKRIEKLLVFHEGVAKALRTTLEVLRGHSVESSLRRAEHTVRAAIGIEHARKRGRKPKGERTRTNAQMLATRQRTAKRLAMFSTTTPTQAKGRMSIGILVKNGYLTKRGDGYVRTAKPFSADYRRAAK